MTLDLSERGCLRRGGLLTLREGEEGTLRSFVNTSQVGGSRGGLQFAGED